MAHVNGYYRKDGTWVNSYVNKKNNRSYPEYSGTVNNQSNILGWLVLLWIFLLFWHLNLKIRFF